MALPRRRPSGTPDASGLQLSNSCTPEERQSATTHMSRTRNRARTGLEPANRPRPGPRHGPAPLALAALVCLCLCLSAGPACRAARGVRKEKVKLEKVKLDKPSAEANPRVDRMEFDPLVAELEQEQDDAQWLQQHRAQGEADDEYAADLEHMSLSEDDEAVPEEAFYREGAGADMGAGDAGADDLDPEDFLYEDHFNITDRIISLFPLIDTDEDDQLSADELTAWHLKLGQRGSMHRTRREMSAADADADEHMTLEEALGVMGVGAQGDESAAEMRAMYSERFRLADLDGDALLNVTEFHDFLHPEESENGALQYGLLAEEMKKRDLDGDGRINVDEFEMTTHQEMEHLSGESLEPHEAMQAHWDSGHHDNPEKAKRDHEAKVQGSFGKLDVNGDGVIDADEFRPVMRHLWPSQRDFAVHHTRDLMGQVDSDEDEHLTLEEMLEHPHAFYHTVEEELEEGGEGPRHDEF